VGRFLEVYYAPLPHETKFDEVNPFMCFSSLQLPREGIRAGAAQQFYSCFLFFKKVLIRSTKETSVATNRSTWYNLILETPACIIS
jgi:hypothetical protein